MSLIMEGMEPHPYLAPSRRTLAPLWRKRIGVIANYTRLSLARNEPGYFALLEDVREAHSGVALTDHCWVTASARWRQTVLVGDRIYMEARVTHYRSTHGTSFERYDYSFDDPRLVTTIGRAPCKLAHNPFRVEKKSVCA